MKIESLAIPDVKLITPPKFGDGRGFFSETWKEKTLTEAGISVHFVQDNHAFSAAKDTVRGLHFQLEPMAQDKLVRVVRGSILDVAVDIRVGSPHFGKWVSLLVSAAAWNQILVPKGFAHGFLTLEPETEVIYKVSEFYAPECDRGIQWNDLAIGINWPLEGQQPVLSAKDLIAKPLRDHDTGFKFGDVHS